MKDSTIELLESVSRITAAEAQAAQSADPTTLSDIMLARAIDEWTDPRGPEYAAFETELESRAQAGSLVCQRLCFWLLRLYAGPCGMPYEVFIEKAEPYARLIAAHGDYRDLMGLSGLLSVKSAWLADEGRVQDSDAARVEALVIIGRLINSGQLEQAPASGADFLVNSYSLIRAEASEDVRNEVDRQLA